VQIGWKNLHGQLVSTIRTKDEPYLQDLNGKVAQQHEARALPLLARGRHLRLDLEPAEEGGQRVDEDPRQRPPEVYELVHGERHEPRREHVVGHVRVPAGPLRLGEVEGRVGGGDARDLGLVRAEGVGDGRGEVVPGVAVSP
jgi:hypothetical protein